MPLTRDRAYATATYDDSRLILRLYELRRDPRMRDARRWFISSFRPKTIEEFARLCPVGSPQNQSMRMVVTYWDMVASFITAGVLNRDLFFESGRELLLVWERLRHLMALRPPTNDPMFSDLAIVGEEFAAWLRARSPEAYESFVTRIK